MKVSSKRAGQALIEVLVAVAVGGILIGGAVALISQTLRSSTGNRFVQSASLLAGELLDKVGAHSQQDWYGGVYSLLKGSTAHYYLTYDSANKKFNVVSGNETVTVDSISFDRYFYLENVCRAGDGSIGGVTVGGAGAVCSGGAVEDPSTQRVTVAVSWPGGDPLPMYRYLARTGNVSVVQTDWSGGLDAAAVVPITGTTNKYSAVDNLDTTSAPGTLRTN